MSSEDHYKTMHADKRLFNSPEHPTDLTWKKTFSTIQKRSNEEYIICAEAGSDAYEHPIDKSDFAVPFWSTLGANQPREQTLQTKTSN